MQAKQQELCLDVCFSKHKLNKDTHMEQQQRL